MTPMEKTVALLRLAALSGTYDGRIRTLRDKRYFDQCRVYVEHSGSILIFTRDVGYHTSGWWKNPQFERCFHLSVSFRDPMTGEIAPFNRELGRRWAKMFFRDDLGKVWVEPPYSPEGKIHDVYHYRLFCDEGWQGIKPQGEVYSTELTERGWKSFTELHGDRAAANVEHGPLGSPPSGE